MCDGEWKITKTKIQSWTLILNKFHTIQVSEEGLAELRECFMEAYDDNNDGKIEIIEVSIMSACFSKSWILPLHQHCQQMLRPPPLICGCNTWTEVDLIKNYSCNIFSGAARRAGPDSMLILCQFVCVCEIISRPLIGRKSVTLPGVVRRS